MDNEKTIDIVKFVGNRTDFLRTQCNYSTRDFAKKAGIAHSALCKILQGTTVPNICTLHSICKALNITLSDFFFGSEHATSMTFKEAKLIERFRKLSPMSQDTLIKLAKCMR